ARPGLTQSDLARSVRVGGSTIHWHINRLRDAGLVEARRSGRSVHYFPALKLA
ncbi:MAG: helix-turn-helix domain-containing protein, partial [Euryarchaeota archaeon]|nr:helix-turn-helix domain-containing protein [Euryarchaeota archaeon]